MTRTYVSARSEGGGRGRGGTRVRSQASRYGTSCESFTESHEARELPLQQLEGCSCRYRSTRWARQRRCQRPAAWSSGWRFSLLLVSRLPSQSALCNCSAVAARTSPVPAPAPQSVVSIMTASRVAFSRFRFTISRFLSLPCYVVQRMNRVVVAVAGTNSCKNGRESSP